MGVISKIKDTVKKVAKGIKKVAKKIITAIPGGDKVWEAGGKLGGKIMEGFSKVTGALGPVGMMALSFVIPAMGPMLSTMWQSFGAGAQALVNSGSAIVRGLGHAGTAIFNGGTFVSNTVGAMGSAIKEGASELMKGNFQIAGEKFGSNMAEAFTGRAGMTGVQQAQTELALKVGGETLAKNAGAQEFLKAKAESALQDSLQAQIAGPDAFLNGTAPTSSVVPTGPDAFAGGATEQLGASHADQMLAAGRGIGDPYQLPGIEAGKYDQLNANLQKAVDAPVTGDASSYRPDAEQYAMSIGKDPTKASTFADSAGKAAGALGNILDTGGVGASMAGMGDAASRKYSEMSGAGQIKAISGYQGGNIYEQLLNRARGVV